MTRIFTKSIEKELSDFNKKFNENFNSSVEDFLPVLTYIKQSKGKLIRPIIGILCAKSIGEFNEEQNLFLQSIELIHNATLFHDDVIDESTLRRGQTTLHEKFSNKLAILTGDYFLSTAVKNICKIKNPNINELFAECMIKICEGEIEQNLTLNKILPIEKYLQKTKQKTALLFELTTKGVSILSKTNPNYNEKFQKFGLNFGMLFQIEDDLKNFMPAENKPILNDLKDGVITAPIIFLEEEFSHAKELLKNKNYDAILKLLKQSNAFLKTQELLSKYKKNAQNAIESLPNSEAKQELLSLLSEFGKQRN